MTQEIDPRTTAQNNLLAAVLALRNVTGQPCAAGPIPLTHGDQVQRYIATGSKAEIAKLLEIDGAPASAAEKPGVLTDERIERVAREAVAAGKLSWLGFEKDEHGRYTVPVLSTADYQFARAIEREVTARLATPAPVTAAQAEINVLNAALKMANDRLAELTARPAAAQAEADKLRAQVEQLQAMLEDRVSRKPNDEQEWAKVDGAIAFHLIERHADNWHDAGNMMESWARARLAAPAAAQAVRVLEEIAGVNIARLMRNLEETSYNEGSVDLACRLSDCQSVIKELLAAAPAAPTAPAEQDDLAEARRLIRDLEASRDGYKSQLEFLRSATSMQTWTAEQIASACVDAGLGILECNSLLVTLKATPSTTAAPALAAVDEVRNAALEEAIAECDLVMLGVDTPEESVGALNCRDAILRLKRPAGDSKGEQA